MMRYIVRVPPPRWRTVMWPLKLRPECFLRTSIRGRSALTCESSLKSIVVMKRRAGLVGLYFLTGILLFEIIDAAQLDLLAGLQGDKGFFVTRRSALAANPAPCHTPPLTANV